LPLAGLLASHGLSLRFRPAQSPQDIGGTPPGAEPSPLWLGAGYRAADAGLELLGVLTDGPAERAGLSPGDVLVALDGLRLTEQNLSSRLARREAGETVELRFFRGDELLATELELHPRPADSCYIEIDAEASEAAITRRRAWLGD
jgi:predicted metalloprotease with PDZ domain